MARHRVASLADLWSGEMLACEAGGTKVVLIRLGDAVHAYEDRCAHLAFPLSQSLLKDGVLTCAAHHWQYDARTGCGINPASARLKRVRVAVEDGAVYVEPEAS